jgi:hypothetical protein
MGLFARLFGGQKLERIYVLSIKHEGFGLCSITGRQKGSALEDFMTLPGEAIVNLNLAPGDLITVGSKKIDNLNSKPLWIEKNGVKFNLV